jgi:hypothetical protein
MIEINKYLYDKLHQWIGKKRLIFIIKNGLVDVKADVDENKVNRVLRFKILNC